MVTKYLYYITWDFAKYRCASLFLDAFKSFIVSKKNIYDYLAPLKNRKKVKCELFILVL